MMNQTLPGKTTGIPTARVEDRRHSLRTPLMLTAWIWRTESPDKPLAIRLLDHSDEGVGFISSVPLAAGEIFDLALEPEGSRRTTLKVAHCEFVSDNAFRVGARALPAPTPESPIA